MTLSPEQVKGLQAFQLAMETALESLQLTQQLGAIVTAWVTEQRDVPTSAELKTIDTIFQGRDDALTEAIKKAEAEGR